MQRVFLASAAMLIGLPCSAAQAQQVAEDNAAADSGDIVVTATRSETLLSKTPVTMTALSSDALRDAGVTDARALSSQVPNLALTENGDSVRISIRGVTSTDGTEKGDPSASFLVNGIYIARPYDTLGSFFDLERVEVLRGPQGTLYGRNTTAGVINVISARAKDIFEASIDAGYGSFNTVDATGMVNVPLGEGIGLRAALNYQRHDAYFTVPANTMVRTSPFRDAISGRLTLGGKIGENFTFTIVGDYSQVKGTGVNGNRVLLDRFFPGALVPTVDPTYVRLPADEQRKLTIGPDRPNWRDNDSYGVMGELSYDFGPVQLTYLGSYRKTNRSDVRDSVLFSAFNNPVTFSGDFKQDSHELRLAFGKGNRLHGQIGGYYFNEKSFIELNLGPPLSQFVVAGATGFAFPQGPTVARSKAAFAQLTYDLTPDLHVTGGIRYTHDLKSRDGATVVDFPTVAAGFCGQLRCVLNENVANRTWSKKTWKVGIDYDAPGLGLIYATVSSGYKAGGFNDGCLTGAGIGCNLTAAQLYYDPETLTSYEAGIKFRLADSIRLNGAYFHYDYSNLQVSQTVANPVGTRISNAGSAKVDGLELELSAQIGPNGKLQADYAYTDARYTRFTPDPVNFPNFSFKGRALDHAPKHVMSFAYAHTFPLGNGGDIELSARTRVSSEYYMIDLNNLSQFRQPAFSKTDLTATYTAPDDRYYAQAFVRNIENRITLASVESGIGAGAAIQAPRTFGIRAGVKF